jgi:hypothetical protein
MTLKKMNKNKTSIPNWNRLTPTCGTLTYTLQMMTFGLLKGLLTRNDHQL